MSRDIAIGTGACSPSDGRSYTAGTLRGRGSGRFSWQQLHNDENLSMQATILIYAARHLIPALNRIRHRCYSCSPHLNNQYIYMYIYIYNTYTIHIHIHIHTDLCSHRLTCLMSRCWATARTIYGRIILETLNPISYYVTPVSRSFSISVFSI